MPNYPPLKFMGLSCLPPIVLTYSILCFIFLFFSDITCAQTTADLRAGVVKILAQVNGQKKVGTGFIVKLENDAAYILTAAHVIEGDPAPQIAFFPEANEFVSARVLGLEGGEPDGLAALKVTGNLPFGIQELCLGFNPPVVIGTEIQVIGFLREAKTHWMITNGTLAGRQNRALTFVAPIGEGNSGGPLLSSNTVLGVVTQTSPKYGLAVPASIAQIVLEGWGINLSKDYCQKGVAVPVKIIGDLFATFGKWHFQVFVSEPVEQIFYKLEEGEKFLPIKKMEGFETLFDTKMNRNNGYVFELEADRIKKNPMFLFKYLTPHGQEKGPYEIIFDLKQATLENAKNLVQKFSVVNMEESFYDDNFFPWFFCKEGMVRLNFHTFTKAGINKIFYSLDSGKRWETVPFRPWTGGQMYQGTPDEGWIFVPPDTRVIQVKIAFIDGTESKPLTAQLSPVLGIESEDHINGQGKGVIFRQYSFPGPVNFFCTEPPKILKQGDIIVAINGQPTRNKAALREIIRDIDVGTSVQLSIRREETNITIPAMISAASKVRWIPSPSP